MRSYSLLNHQFCTNISVVDHPSHGINDLGLLWGVLIPFLCQSVHFLITFKSPRHVPQSHWVKTESSTTSLVAFPYQFRCYGDGVKRSNVRKSVVHWEPKVMNPLGWLCFLRGTLYRTRQGYLPVSVVQGLLIYTPNPGLRFMSNPSVYQTSVEKSERLIWPSSINSAIQRPQKSAW